MLPEVPEPTSHPSEPGCSFLAGRLGQAPPQPASSLCVLPLGSHRSKLHHPAQPSHHPLLHPHRVPVLCCYLNHVVQPHWGPGISPRLDLNLPTAEPGRLAPDILVKWIHKWVRWIHKCAPPPPPHFVLLLPVDSPHPQLEARCWGQGRQLSLAVSTPFFSRLTNPRASEDTFLKAGRTPDGPHQLPPPPRILLSMPYNEHMLGTHMR